MAHQHRESQTKLYCVSVEVFVPALVYSSDTLCPVAQHGCNVYDRDVGYDRNPDGQRTIPAPHGIRCICPKKSLIATKFESREHHIIENK